MAARRSIGRTLAVAAIVLALATGAFLATHRATAPPSGIAGSLSVAEALRSGADLGFARAAAPRAFSFPADDGPHPEFRTEWWYYTGNLVGPGGRRFGFQLTFFRNALAAHPPARTSAWATRDVYLAHFAVTDVAAGTFRSFEKIRRGALGLAGAQAAPFRVWLDRWQVVGPPPASQSTVRPQSAAESTPMRLTAAAADVALDLTLDRGKPPVLQGEKGLSRKGALPGQASYYYSRSRLPARGRITVAGRSFAVTGLAWMDREWSTSSLSPDQVGWDWFALHLTDGRDLMLYRLRRRDGTVDPASSGTLIGPQGETTPLAAGDVVLTPTATWKSPQSGATYPARWRLRVPSAHLDLEIRPDLANQELATSFHYWEGAVEVTGTAGTSPLRGSGYVELTGYADSDGPVASAGGPAPSIRSQSMIASSSKTSRPRWQVRLNRSQQP